MDLVGGLRNLNFFKTIVENSILGPHRNEVVLDTHNSLNMYYKPDPMNVHP